MAQRNVRAKTIWQWTNVALFGESGWSRGQEGTRLSSSRRAFSAADCGVDSVRRERRSGAVLATCGGSHRVDHLRIALGEPSSRELLSCALGISRYLPLFVHICPGSLGRSGLAWVPLRAGAGYGQPAQVKIHAGMGLDRCAMVAWRGGAVCASPDSSCACSRAGITQANLAFWALEQAVATQLRQL